MSSSEASWEIKYKGYLEEEPISEKIKKIEKSIKGKAKRREAKIGKLENQKVTGNFKTKEEYEAAVEAHKKQIEDIKKEKADLEASLENDEELQGYRNFEKNKDKIKNIYEYRNTLIVKLENLPKQIQVDLAKKKLENEKEQQARLLRIGQYQVEIEDINIQLTEGKNLTNEQKQILELEMRTKKDAIKRLYSERVESLEEIKNLENKETNLSEKSMIKKEEYQRKIAKCNLLAESLLKGKGIDDIELNVEQEGRKLVSKDENSKKILESAREENDVELGIRKGKPTSKYDPIKETQKAKEVETNKENTQIVEVSEFAKKHPRLAKIANFFKNIKNWFVYEEENDIEDNTNKEIGDEVAKILKHKKELDREDVLLKQIAQDGKEKAFRDILKVNVKEEANRLAAKHGGIYERQDGATMKKETKEVTR